MELKEYIFIDERRLQTYFEQISDPVKYVKVPSWKASISITGPSAEGSQTLANRNFTKYEKINTVLHHISKRKLMSLQRPSYSELSEESIKTVFRCEKLMATEVFLPGRK